MSTRKAAPIADLFAYLIDGRDVAYTLFGLALLAITIRSGVTRSAFFNLPLFYVAFGALLGWAGLPVLSPFGGEVSIRVIEHVSEIIVILSLAGAGLAIDTRGTWRNWQAAYLLLLICMPLTLLAIFGLGYWWLGLAWPSAMLLAAILAPTDPVLARSVQVGPPGRKESPMQVSLTAEAGLNDGLAFPFVYLALAAAAVGYAGQGWPEFGMRWLTYDLAYRVIAGVLVGYAMGHLLARFTYSPVGDANHGAWNSVLVVLAATCLSYGSAELINGYGFLAVFAATRAARQFGQHRDDLRYERLAHHGAEQLETVLLVILLLWFGTFLGGGGLTGLTWTEAGVAAVILLIVRPVAGYLSVIGLKCARADRMRMAFFGIRGMGTVFYLAYAQTHGTFGDIEALWRIASVTMLASIIVHGFAANFAIEQDAEVSDDKLDALGPRTS